jgi:hypothetical protein
MKGNHSTAARRGCLKKEKHEERSIRYFEYLLTEENFSIKK